MSETPQIETAGIVARVLYANPDNFYTVAVLEVREDGPELHLGSEITIVGTLAGIKKGERIRVKGTWTWHSRHGRQLAISRYEVDLPKTAEGIKAYLASGVIPGVGPKTADLLYKRFGDDVLEVIDKNPERLKQVRGVGKKTIARIVKSWKSHRDARNAMVFFQSLGITNRMVSRLQQQYGDDAAGVVRGNPYRLVEDVSGIGFRRADDIATALGLDSTHPRRIRAGVVHTLGDARRDGHVCLPREVLLEQATKLLDVPVESVESELAQLAEQGRVQIEDDGLIYDPALLRAEKRVADNLIRLMDHPRTLPGDLDLATGAAQSTLGVILSDGQRQAVRTALTQPLAVVTGGPGTGKTTIVRAITSALESFGCKVTLGAPTGRAAKRLAQSTGRDARTLHRVLEWQPTGGFARDGDNPLATDAVIVDETSMVDIELFDSLLDAIADGTRLVLVGDVDQLPSVGPGAVLRDIIDSEAIPVVRLREIHRQESGSLIVDNAHRILAGHLPENPPEGVTDADFYWIAQDEPAAISSVMVRVLTRNIPSRFGLDPRRDVQVLTPMHRGELGSEGLNRAIGGVLNPGRGTARLAPGDKVMQIRNNYEKEVFNGDVGFVTRVADDGRTLLVRFDDDSSPRLVPYEPNEQDQLVLAWAISIHKSQGSEYPAVVMPLHGQHYVMLRRNLLYTAVTRGRRLVVLVGSAKALRAAVRGTSADSRHGQLAARLRALAR